MGSGRVARIKQKKEVIANKVWTCNLCNGAPFDSKTSLENHNKAAHATQSTCSYCNMVFQSKAQFLTHQDGGPRGCNRAKLN